MPSSAGLVVRTFNAATLLRGSATVREKRKEHLIKLMAYAHIISTQEVHGFAEFFELHLGGHLNDWFWHFNGGTGSTVDRIRKDA